MEDGAAARTASRPVTAKTSAKEAEGSPNPPRAQGNISRPTTSSNRPTTSASASRPPSAADVSKSQAEGSPKSRPRSTSSPKTSRPTTPKSGSPRPQSPTASPRAQLRASKPNTPSLSRMASSSKLPPGETVPTSIEKAELVKAIKADQEAASAANSRPVSAKNGMRSTSARVSKTLDAAATAGKIGLAARPPSRHGLNVIKGEKGQADIIKTMPMSGGWVGWYSNSQSEMTKIFFEVHINIDENGVLNGGPREESSPFSCTGTVSKTEPHKVSFLETERFGHDIQFDGVFVEKAIAGRWHKSQGTDPRGRLCLFRISDGGEGIRAFRPGRWAGCCWSEKEKDWLQVSFAWLETRGSILYGKDELTDDNVFITTRGMFDEASGRIRIMVTEWFEQDSTFRIYSGIVAADGHIRGLWTSSDERDLEEEEDNIFDTIVQEEDEATFRIWRVDGDDEIEWLPKSQHPRLNSRIAEGKWKGAWTYDGGIQSTDHCTWNLRFIEGNRIQGEGLSVLEDLEEGFICDGTYDEEKGTVKLYQSYLTTLSVYVYDLKFNQDGWLEGKGSSRDDSDGLVVDFKLKRQKEK
ncbi:hypothetical protein HDU97_010365 [Phlyctochytrium planicorne]|nr:hypothetical protein HDU97_010365 [Phlyctochytrium planicorne]